MKHLLFPLTLLLFSFTAQAQWSAGIRSGIGNWIISTYSKETYLQEKVNQSIWQNQIYVRYELGEMLAVEAGLSKLSAESAGETILYCGTGLPMEYDFLQGTNYGENVYALELRGMLRPSVFRWGRLSNELGFVLAPGISRIEKTETIGHVTSSDVTYSDQKTSEARSCMQFGFEDQLHYRIGTHLDLMGAGGFRYMNGARFIENGIYAQLGLGYRF